MKSKTGSVVEALWGVPALGVLAVSWPAFWMALGVIDRHTTGVGVPFWQFTGMSALAVAVSLAGSLLSGSLSAYAFSRISGPGRDLCFAAMLGVMMEGAEATMFPPFWSRGFFAAMLYVLLFRQSVMAAPPGLVEAAKIDGCGFWRTYWRIVLPLTRSTLGILAILSLLPVWNDFMGRFVYPAHSSMPLSVYVPDGWLQIVFVAAKIPLTLPSGMLLTTLPAMIAFFFIQRRFLKGSLGE